MVIRGEMKATAADFSSALSEAASLSGRLVRASDTSVASPGLRSRITAS